MSRSRAGFIPLPPDEGDVPEDVDADHVLGQITAIQNLLAGFMMTFWALPGMPKKPAEDIEKGALNPDLLAALERQHGPEFIDGYRSVVSNVFKIFRGD